MITIIFFCHVPLIGTNITTMYIAVALDENHESLLIAFALGTIDCDDSWAWFMRRLKECIGDNVKNGFISHMSESINYSIQRVYPDSYHGYCCNSVAENIQTYTGNNIVVDQLF